MSDAWGAVQEALAQLRATHGRLPQLDAIERQAACMEAERRELRVMVAGARGALGLFPQLNENGVVGGEYDVPSALVQ